MGYSVSTSLAQMLDLAECVVIGKVLAKRQRLSDSGERVETNYVVNVREVIKGAERLFRNLVVVVPGGIHQFDDGVVIHQVLRFHSEIQQEGTYVLFLRRIGTDSRSGAAQYELWPGIQGQFELAFTEGRVYPGVTAKYDPLRVRYAEATPTQLLEDLHRAASTVVR